MPDSSEKPTHDIAFVCIYCGAENSPAAKKCWMCESELDEPAKEPAFRDPQRDLANHLVIQLSIWITLIVVLLVGFGLFWENPAVACLFLVCAAPALFAASLGTLVGRSGSVAATSITTAATFAVVSILMIPVVSLLALYGALVALTDLCAKLLGGGG